jgi:hypothetical protein
LLRFSKKEPGGRWQLQKKFGSVAEVSQKRPAPPPSPFMPDPRIILTFSDERVSEQASFTQRSPARGLEIFKKTSGHGLRITKKQRIGW